MTLLPITPGLQNASGAQAGTDPVMQTSTFRITDEADPTKQVAFQASAITTGTTRTITIPDSDINLGVSFSTISESGGNTFISTALRIGGVNGPFHQLHMSDGNLYMEGGGEVGHIVKRLINNVGNSGPLGNRTNPQFIDKRISQAGDLDFEVKTLFSADEEAERVIFKWDSKGIFAQIGKQGLLGRQIESYLYDGLVHPWYGISSEGTNHRLELGSGLVSPDCAITRTDTQSISLQVGPDSSSLQSKLTVYGDAVVVQAGVSVVMPQIATPGASGAGSNKLYFKSDDNLYKMDSAGTETAIGGGGGGGSSLLLAEATGGETVLTLATDLIADKHYTGIILFKNNVAAVRSFSLTANGGSTTIIPSFALNPTGDAAAFFIDLAWIPIRGVGSIDAYLAYRTQRAGQTAASGYVIFYAASSNITSIEIKAATSGTIGIDSTIRLIKGVP